MTIEDFIIIILTQTNFDPDIHLNNIWE